MQPTKRKGLRELKISAPFTLIDRKFQQYTVKTSTKMSSKKQYGSSKLDHVHKQTKYKDTKQY